MKMKFSSEVMPHYVDRWTLTGATVTVYLTSDFNDYEVFHTEVDTDLSTLDLDALHQRGVAEFAARLREALIEEVDR